MNRLEFIMNPEGRILKRTINEELLDVQDSLLDAIGGSVSRVAYHVFPLPELGMVNMRINEGSVCYYTVRLKSIPMKSPFRLVENVLVPNFSSNVDPVLPLIWTPPEGMGLAMLIIIQSAKVDVNKYESSTEFQYLVAFDAKTALYRMPLANVYDDGRLCLGRFDAVANSHVEVIDKVLAQFKASQWNSDLWRKPELSQKMFRFKPSNENFEVLPPLEPWQKLCEKISTGILNNLVL